MVLKANCDHLMLNKSFRQTEILKNMVSVFLGTDTCSVLLKKRVIFNSLILILVSILIPLHAFAQLVPPSVPAQIQEETQVDLSSIEIFEKMALKLKEEARGKKAINYKTFFYELFQYSEKDRKFRYSNSEMKRLLDVIEALYKDPDKPEKNLQDFLGHKFDFSKISGNDIKKISKKGLVYAIASNRSENRWTAFLNILYISLGISDMQGISAQYGTKGQGSSDLRNLSSSNANARASSYANKKGYTNKDGKKFSTEGLMDSEVIAFLIREYIQKRKFVEPVVVKTEKTLVKEEVKKEILLEPSVFKSGPPEHKCISEKGFKTTILGIDAQIREKLLFLIKEDLIKDVDKDRETYLEISPQFQMIRKMTRELTTCLPELYKEFKGFEMEYLESFEKNTSDLPFARLFTLQQLDNKRAEIELISWGLKKNISALQNIPFTTIPERRSLKYLGIELKEVKKDIIKIHEDQKNILKKINGIARDQGDKNYPWAKVEKRNNADIELIFENIGVVQLYITAIDEKIAELGRLQSRKKMKGGKSWNDNIFITKGFRLLKSFDKNFPDMVSKSGGNISDQFVEGVLGFSHSKTPDFKAEFLALLLYWPDQEIFSKGFEIGANWYYPNSKIFGADLTVNPFLRTYTITMAQNGATADFNGESKIVDAFLEIRQIQLGNRFRFKAWNKSFWDLTFSYNKSSVSGTLNDAIGGTSATTTGEGAGIGIELGYGIKF